MKRGLWVLEVLQGGSRLKKQMQTQVLSYEQDRTESSEAQQRATERHSHD